MARSGTEIRGLKEAFETLRQVDPELYKQVRKDIRKDAKPLLTEAKRRVPQFPLSGWNVAGAKQQDIKGRKTLRTGTGFPVYDAASAKRGITLSIKNKKRKGYGGKWLAIAMVQNDAAGMIFDYARKSANKNRFPQALNVRNPKPSRYMWKAADEHRGTVNASMRDSIKKVEKRINRKLR